MIRIALDAMGGDHAPSVIVDGTVLAADRFPDLQLILTGPEPTLGPAVDAAIAANGVDPSVRDRIEIAHATEAVGMHESPVEALRKKPDSSLRKMISLHKEGRCDAVFSAGNTGAVVAGATMLLGMLPGVRRAGIAVALPVGEKPVVLIDVGANVQCKPLHLVQYGVMAKEFLSRVYGTDNPHVGLLNVGEEDQKGNRLTKETHDLFRSTDIDYVGNVEGRDIFHGRCDAVVCDGFVGNIVLKVAEGMWEKLMQLIIGEIGSLSAGGELGKIIKNMACKLDYSEYGGAPLLGVNGTVIIGHGRSDAKAVVSAVRWTREMCLVHVNDAIVEAVAGLELESDAG